jgi:hypothetical protein
MTTLYCASCRRTTGSGPTHVETVNYLGMQWCTSCAAIGKSEEGSTYISMPSPGRMYESSEDDPITAWEDCYEKKPKKRILVNKARSEIQRAWDLWDDDKSRDIAMFNFFGWLVRYRPYFLTFRCKGDPWQTVHSWLIQHERKKSNARNSQ